MMERKTRIIHGSRREAILQALDVLRMGGLVAFPTDTVYGVGALAFDARAVEAIYAAKERPNEKAIPVLLAGPEQLALVSMDLPPQARILADRFWPGAVTLVVPKHPDLPEAVSAGATVGVRVPDHPIALALLRLSGPLAVTSANLSGKPSPLTAMDVLQQLEGRIGLILDGGRVPGGVSSTVVDCTVPEIRVLREGPISERQIRQVLAGEPKWVE
jgi:L-threonylcarbamoyladenylate synthase